jgi:glutaredoxin-related protein
MNFQEYQEQYKNFRYFEKKGIFKNFQEFLRFSGSITEFQEFRKKGISGISRNSENF